MSDFVSISIKLASITFFICESAYTNTRLITDFISRAPLYCLYLGWIVYNYPPKGRWIVVEGIHLALFTDPERKAILVFTKLDGYKNEKK